MARYVTARTVLLENVLEEIRGAQPHLTDHGPRHIQNVLENVFKLLEGDLKYFSAIELYILGLSVLFHDVGNIEGRKDHNKRIAKYYDRVRKGQEFAHEKALVVRICQAHTGRARNGSRNTLTDVPPHLQLDGESVRSRELAAIVRFADELAEGRQRTSEYLRTQGAYDADSIPHHDYAAATDIAIDGGNRRVAVTYQFNINTGKDLEAELSRLREFLNMACRRLAKMDLERRYARFHCSKPLVPFQRISVCLDVQVDGDFVDPPLEATISDEVSLDAVPDLLPKRDPKWDPAAVVEWARKEVEQRTKDAATC